MVIIISLGVACVLMVLLSKRPRRLAEFGFGPSRREFLWLALLFGAVLGLIVGWLSALFPVKPPYDVSKLAPVLIVTYFVVGASVQEEIIFRGLLQTLVERFFKGDVRFFGHALGTAVIVVAVLFCLIHIPEGPVVALGALLLGLIAGELRKRSASLLPAIAVHALFNLAGAIFELTPKFHR